MGSLDDACIFFLASLPNVTYDIAMRVFDAYSMGELKDQTAKRGSLGQKIDLKGNNFKPLRGLEIEVVNKLLSSVESKEISIGEMAKQAKKIKNLKEVQKKFIELTGVTTWEEAQALFPIFTTAEALDEFVGCVTTKLCTPRYGTRCN